MTRGADIDDSDELILLALGDIVDRSPEAADDAAPALAEGSDIHAVDQPAVARAPTTEIDALLLAYLLDLDDPVRG